MITVMDTLQLVVAFAILIVMFITLVVELIKLSQKNNHLRFDRSR
ncbi:putative holin-like toxin [Fructobacillus fructosus]|nr:putative holin-like toxin [Fructobacillus fructosus]MBD9366076.1 putative holin-like toxin [Leuconostoc mesenteroides]